MSIESIENRRKIIELALTHNGCYPDDQIDICSLDKTEDVNDIYICVYNDNQVGLFKKVNFTTAISECKHFSYGRGHYSTFHYTAESIYIGYNSNYTGIKVLHKENHNLNMWAKEGYATTWDKKVYLANCNMYDEMSFDDMRLLMYEDGNLTSPYEVGKATKNEILQTLLYAKRYYGGNIRKVKKSN